MCKLYGGTVSPGADRVRWLPWLAAVVVIAGCIRLSVWQLDRAAEKEGLREARQQAPAITLADVDASTPRFARVTGDGRFDGHRQVLLDNQVSDGRAGVHVFTPFQAGGRVFLVNRGWAVLDRGGELPDPPVPEGLERIQGILDDPPQVGFQLGRAAPLDPDQWPNLVTYYDPERLSGVFGPDLATRVIRLAPDHPAHLTGIAWPEMRFGPQRHRAYAFQWALLAAAVAVIAIGLWLRGKLHDRRSD